MGDPSCPSLNDYGLTNQEEMRLAAKGIMHGSHHEESQALAADARRRKGKEGKRSAGRKEKGGRSGPAPKKKKKDLSRVQCFKSEKYGHYARHCPLLRKGKQQASTIDADEEPP